MKDSLHQDRGDRQMALSALDKARERLIGEAPYFAQETVEAIRKHLGERE